MNVSALGRELAELSRLRWPCGGAMVESTAGSVHKVRQFAMAAYGEILTGVTPIRVAFSNVTGTFLHNDIYGIWNRFFF